jgi:hypothetical protein
MAAHRGERPGQFMYEPSYPPTVPAGQTINAYRRGRPRRRRGPHGRWRRWWPAGGAPAASAGWRRLTRAGTGWPSRCFADSAGRQFGRRRAGEADIEQLWHTGGRLAPLAPPARRAARREARRRAPRPAKRAGGPAEEACGRLAFDLATWAGEATDKRAPRGAPDHKEEKP